MNKSQRLKAIEEEIKNCKDCKANKLGMAVAGEGNPNAQIVFTREAPGYQESRSGRPFVGRSGQFLIQLLSEVGLTRKMVFITSPVKYYPVKPNINKTNRSRENSGRAPTDKEINHGKLHLLKQLEVIRPKLIVLLGKVAAKALIGKDLDLIDKVHGSILQTNDYKFFFTYHPAAAIRFPKIKKLMQEDFQKLAKIAPITTRATK